MRILIIEDDLALSDALKLQLEHAGYQADCCYDGKDALYYAVQPIYTLIILDRLLPSMNGLSILKYLRESGNHTPVILATAVDTVPERIAGLDAGADDYIVKPYDIEELLARIRALTRRPGNIENRESLTYKDLNFQAADFELHCGDKKKKLSRHEADLLECFLKNPEQTLTRPVIYSSIWGPDGEVEEGNLDTYIYYLRKCLKMLKSKTQIKTVHGIGYRLEPIAHD